MTPEVEAALAVADEAADGPTCADKNCQCLDCLTNDAIKVLAAALREQVAEAKKVLGVSLDIQHVAREYAHEQTERAEAAEAEALRLRPALQNLVTKIDAVQAHPAYVGTFALAMLHDPDGEYDGPTWVAELAAAHAALEGT